jgi:hypothetical protein
MPLPPGKEDEGGGGEDGEEADHGIAEPVFFLAFVEGELEAAYADGNEAETHEVDF